MKIDDNSIREKRKISVSNLFSSIQSLNGDLLVAFPMNRQITYESELFLLEMDPHAEIDTVLDHKADTYLVDYTVGDFQGVFEFDTTEPQRAGSVEEFIKSMNHFIENDAYR